MIVCPKCGKELPDGTKFCSKCGTPLADVKPKAEEPKAEAPKKEEPKAEAPKKEEPKAEAPKAEAPKAEAPKAEAPKAEAPKAEAPKAEAPKAEAPKAEEPKAEAPKAEGEDGEKKPKTWIKYVCIGAAVVVFLFLVISLFSGKSLPFFFKPSPVLFKMFLSLPELFLLTRQHSSCLICFCKLGQFYGKILNTLF